MLFAGAASMSLVAGCMLSAVQGCTCGLFGGVVGYVAVGLLALCWRGRRRGRGSAWGLLLLCAVLPCAAVFLIDAEVVSLYFVAGESMAPTLRPGDSMLVSYLHLMPRRGDLVVFRNDAGRLLVKRVVGLPGDRVSIQRGQVWLNGRRLPLVRQRPSPTSLEARYYTETGAHRHYVLFERPWLIRPSLIPRVVPRGHLFVLGDNRDRSADSRRRGYVSLNDIVGIPFALGPRAADGALGWGRAGWLL